jgi:hypothetical protein
MCPVDAAGPCGKTWSGCVAVSMAQVMKFWGYPSSGDSSFSYNHFKYGQQSANFGTATYNWSGMPNTSGNAEISKLMYHLGVSVRMNYGVSGSGAYFSAVQHAITKYFRYSTNVVCINKYGYSDANWAALLKKELDESRPIMFAGGTHAFVLDGYQTGNYFHVNWGWGGSYDGYFLITNLKPGSSDYTTSQSAFIGTVPKTLEPTISASEIKDISCGTVISDSTNDGTNKINKYKNSYLQTTGNEKFYSITTSVTGRLKAKLTGLKGKSLRLFILSYPHRDSLLVMGDSIINYNNAKPGKYYIIVDGLYGENGSYNLKVICPDNKPDLTIQNTSVDPYYIESNQTNITLKCCVKNIGNLASTGTKTIFYYSEDNSLNAGDVKLDSISVPALNPGDSVLLTQIVNMTVITEGFRYILFEADPQNSVVETDETDNISPVYFQGIPESVMNCSTAVPLQSGIWYNGNTETQGVSLIASYLEMRGYTGKEVIHSITPLYEGVSTISFSKNKSKMLSCFVLSACSENKLETTVYGEGAQMDTANVMSFKMIKNNTYYLVVDGSQGSTGEYWLKVELADSCPKPQITLYGDSTVCEGINPYLTATNGYSAYQWYSNGFPVITATSQYFSASESGNYQVEVSENGCTARSGYKTITINSTPKPSIIPVGTDSIQSTVSADSYEWYYNEVKNSLTAQTIKPEQYGGYKVIAILNTCKSEKSEVYSYTLTDIGEINNSTISILPNPSNGIFTIRNNGNPISNGTIEIFTVTGNVLYRQNMKEFKETLVDFTSKPKGIYLLKIYDGSNYKVIQLIKE